MSRVEKPKHCWFSQKMWDLCHDPYATIAYRCRVYYMIAGQRTEVTVVSDTLEHGCRWDDMRYLGVGTWLQTQREW